MKKQRFIVVPRNKSTQENGIKTEKRTLNFGRQTARWIDDPAEAREINSTYGVKGSGDVWVEQDENLEWHEHHDGNTDGRTVTLHHYTFQGVDTSKLRTTRDNGYVWVMLEGGKQKRIRRDEAQREGYEIIPQKRKVRRMGAEVRQ